MQSQIHSSAQALAVLFIVSLTVIPSALSATAPAPDPQIEALIARMTIEEKAGQLSIFADEVRAINPHINPDINRRQRGEMLEAIRAGRVGALMNGRGVEGGRLAQKTAVEQSRLKIPLLFGADVIHGFRTIFPVPLAEAASFEPELAERTARAAAIEATAAGLHWNFAPMVDIARDQRWGRVVEGAGEDVYLGKLFAVARVRGFQGAALTAEDSMLATPKHFAGYGAVQGGMDYNTVELTERTLREVHLPTFRAAFEAGALSTMSAFNDIGGLPASASPHLLTQILREEWGFRGFVVSDYTADQELIPHGYAEDDAHAAALALTAGVDMSMQSGFYIEQLPGLVESGRLPMPVVDEAVRRVLRIKKALGLFDNPYRSLDARREATQIATPEHRALAREAGRRSIVLLKNEGDVLPLAKTAKVALIGPLGDDIRHMHGPWVLFGDWKEAVTPRQGLVAALGGEERLTVVKGSEIEAPIEGGIDAAVRAARAADVVLLAIGEGENMSGEAQSRTDIVVPAPQQALAEAVAATGKPVVVLLTTGRALALKGAVRDAPAILVTWFLGSEGGNAVADVVYGDFNPSGRLPVSFPQESGQQPYYYNHRRTGRPQVPGQPAIFKARYRESSNEALYSFGHGRGYANMRYDVVTLSSETLPWNGSLTATTKVTNLGKVAGEEVVQLYIHDRVASVTRPVRELKGFKKISLAPGETASVSFTLSRQDLEFVGADMQWTAEPGVFDLWIAPSSSDGIATSFRLEHPSAGG